MEKENTVKFKSRQFAIDIIYLYKDLAENKKEYVLSKQVLRSGTSIGANLGSITKSTKEALEQPK